MAADTGATTNLANNDTPLANEQPTPNGISVTTASNDTIIGTSKGYLPINTNPKAATCHRVPNIHTPLLSVGQLCDDNCCWTHSCDLQPLYDSETCQKPAPGHQREATLHNRMGGNNRCLNLVT